MQNRYNGELFANTEVGDCFIEAIRLCEVTDKIANERPSRANDQIFVLSTGARAIVYAIAGLTAQLEAMAP